MCMSAHNTNLNLRTTVCEELDRNNISSQLKDGKVTETFEMP